MRKIYLSLLLLCTVSQLFSQGENCSAATLISNGSCVTGSAGLTQNIPGCVGTADDDVWYRFVATSTSHSVTVTGSAGFDAVLQVFSGPCSALVSMACVDNSLSGQSESTVVSGLTIGNTYYIRTYHYYTGSGSSTFTLCLNTPPPPPSNNNCASAINLTVNSGCVQTSGTTLGATTQTQFPICAGTPNDDVWYTFTATNYTQTIQVTGSANMDAVIQLFSGSCGSFTQLSCTDNTFSGGVESVTASGLTPGVQYFFRVYDYYSDPGATFSVCVSGNSIIPGSQPNDDPCSAIQLPAVTSDCNYLMFSNLGATTTSSGLAPNPTGCTGGTGGFTASSKDVWFAITVPASGNLCITPMPNYTTAPAVTDGVMALYSGSCGSLTQIACSDDADGTSGASYNYPGTANDFLPYLNVTGLTPGSTVYLRYWGWGSQAGDFGLCVQAPTNDLCANALYICDLNGYAASTSPAYTPDRPGTGAGQMYGNNETPAGVDQPNGTNTGGIFGYYPPSNIPGPFSSPAIDVNIDNNSWIRFTAATPTVSLRVNVYNCWENGPTNQGVQMQIFSGTNCSSFTPVSSFREGIGTYTVTTAVPLIVGNDYYLMVDGWGGNICNYSIQALSGVAFPDITATPTNICAGQSATLTAPSGATSYTWAPTGETTQSIVVSPGTTMTYSCIVTGVCGYKQTLTKTITMFPSPSVTINGGAAITTCGTNTITLTGSGASTYTWSTGNTTSSFTVAPSGSTSYSVIGTAANGCTNTAITNVTVNPVPTILPAGTNTICNGASTNLTVSGANTYTWSPAASLSSSTGTNVVATPTTGTNYTITGTATNGCTNTATYSVTVNPKPNVSSTATSTLICSGGSVTLQGTGANSYTWTGGITDGVAFTPTVTTTYTVTGTNATTGCTNTAVRTISVNTTPTVSSMASNSVICNGQSVTLNGTGANTYTWTGGVTNGVAFTPTTTNTYTVTGTATNGCTNTAVATITVNPKPTVSSTATNSVICNGQSVTLNGTGANTYTWTGGITNGVAFTPTSTTTYTVIGTDAVTGCTNTAVRTITVNSLPSTIASTSGSITCATNTINLNSSTSGLSYTWTAPSGSSITGGTANNQNAIGQGAGTYTLVVMNASNCTYSTTLSANVNTTVPTASATNGTLTCAVTSTVLVGGPTSGVTYNWSGPGILGSNTTANITVTVTGNYSLVTTSTLTGCSSTVTAIGTVTNNLTTPTVSAGSNQTITCAAPTVTLTGNATSGSSYSWSNGATTSTTSVGGSGIYTLTATNPVTGCSSSATVQVIPSAGTPTGTLSAVTNSITCANTTVSVGITSTTTPISILWAGPGIVGATNTPTINVNQGGTYTVTLTNTSNSCSAPYTIVVPSNTTPVVASASISPSSSITCSTQSITLSASPTGANYAYTWAGAGIVSGGTTANPVVNAGGNYTVTITNTITGCSGATGTTQVFVPTNTTTPSLNLSANSVTTTCSNPSAVVTATSSSGTNTTYTWTAPSTGNLSNPNVSNPSLGGSGVFTVVATNTINGCVSAQATVNVVPDNNIPTYTLSANAASITCSTTTPSVTISTNVSGATFSWTPNPASGGNTATPTFTAPGNYTCVITNTVNNCSTNSPMVSINTNTTSPMVTIAPSSSITCANTTVNITSTVSASSATYTWSGAGITGANNNATANANSGGIYTLNVTDLSNGCVGTATTTVNTNTTAPTLTVSSTNTLISCGASSATLNAVSSITDTPVWFGTTSSTLAVTSAGDYVATVVDAITGCSASQTITITSSINPPDANAGAAVVMPCASPTVALLGSSTTTDVVTYNWNGPTIISGANTSNPVVGAVGIYTLTVTNTANGCSATATVDVSQSNVIANFYADPMFGEAPLTVNLTDSSTNATTFSWDFGNGLTSTQQNPSTLYPDGGTYTITLVASSGPCSDTATKVITVEDGFVIEVPNVFTPNGDGVNEAFHIKMKGVKSAEGTIYNRWGQILYSWDALNTSWDGKAANGEICPDANYYYIIKVTDKKDKEHLVPGYVLIIR